MIVCSKCGASNGPGSAECRMCGSQLTQSDAAATQALGIDSRYTTVVSQNLKTNHGTASLTECLVCPECQTIGQIGWLFCPQCGKEVDASFLRTTERPDQNATIEAAMSPDLETVQISFQDLVSQRRPEAAQPAAGNRDQAAPIQPQPAEWRLEPELPQPATPVQPMRNPIDSGSPVANSSNGAGEKEPNAPAPALGHETVACTECGSDNDSKYSFCLSCGAGLPVTKTVVMASIRTQAKPRLRLLVLGEASGPTYEIKDEARIGRTEGSITFPRDNFMSTSHARVVKRGADFILVDEASSNGTFIKVKSETKLEPGDVILVGGQLLRYEA